MVLTIPQRRTSHGEAIRALRLARGYRAVEFAAAISISHSYLANIEADRKRASAHVLERIADALQVPVEAISIPGLNDTCPRPTKTATA